MFRGAPWCLVSLLPKNLFAACTSRFSAEIQQRLHHPDQRLARNNVVYLESSQITTKLGICNANGHRNCSAISTFAEARQHLAGAQSGIDQRAMTQRWETALT